MSSSFVPLSSLQTAENQQFLSQVVSENTNPDGSLKDPNLLRRMENPICVGFYCPKCDKHLTEEYFYTSKTKIRPKSSWCKSCCREYKRLYRAENRDSLNRRQRDWVKSNRSRVNSSHSKWRNKNRDIVRATGRKSWLKNQYGLTEEDLAKRLVEQNHKCAIASCPRIITRKTLVVDHDHVSGKVRSLLCRPCNGALGFVEKLGWLESVLQYLKACGGTDV